jgi:hypothetical protein
MIFPFAAGGGTETVERGSAKDEEPGGTSPPSSEWHSPVGSRSAAAKQYPPMFSPIRKNQEPPDVSIYGPHAGPPAAMPSLRRHLTRFN